MECFSTDMKDDNLRVFCVRYTMSDGSTSFKWWGAIDVIEARWLSIEHRPYPEPQEIRLFGMCNTACYTSVYSPIFHRWTTSHFCSYAELTTGQYSEISKKFAEHGRSFVNYSFKEV